MSSTGPRSTAGAVAAITLAALCAPPAAAVVVTPLVRVAFQPAASPVPAGHVADTGAPYDAARGSGWVRQDALRLPEPTPLNLASNTRDRAVTSADPLRNTLIHLQYGDTGGTNGVPAAGAWQYDVPPGTYTVTASAGDETSLDSAHVVRVEGVTAVNRFVPDSGTRHATGTVTTTVADGRLTVDAIGGTNTKLHDVAVSRVVRDTAAPAVPAAPTAVAGDGQVTLSWPTGAAGDLLGHRVHRDGVPVGAGLVTGTSFVDTGVANGTAAAYSISAVDTSGNSSARSAATTATPAEFAVKVNFSDRATAPPAGYARDFGEPFGARDGGTYGWVRAGTTTPVSLVGNGRDRGAAANPDVRLATLVHAQLPGSGVTGSWELAVPDGAYEVTAAVGDAGTAVDSVHQLNVEDQNAVAAFVPGATVKHATATRVVVVADGRLTLSPLGGTNTKFHFVDVASVPAAAARPSVRTTTPANLATGVDPTTSVVADLRLPGGGVDPATLTPATVVLTRVADGAVVPAGTITSGGGDVVNLSPLAPLAPNTAHRFSLTDGVRDVAGRAFTPHSIVFTTGTGPGTGVVRFEKVVGVATGASFTSVTAGPDGRLYAATSTGAIHRFPVLADGTLGAATVVNTVRTHATAAALPGAPNRTVIGLAFDPASTAAAPVLWITDNFGGTSGAPDWSGKIARLSGPDLGTYTEVVTDLPRSIKDHETNSLAFGPDGALYATQGSMNAMGAPDSTWGNRPEHLLSAAVLRLDPARLPAALPLNARTEDGGSYDPRAASAPLTVHATGVRNAYDLVWHRNGHLYVPTNGSAAGGAAPATPATLPPSCATRPGGPYTGPAVPGIANNPDAETDYVFDVKPGRYYGHPAPVRCEWVLAGGNPSAATDPFQVPSYPVGTLPDRDLDLAGITDAGLHASANGAVEYRGGAFGGALDGKLLVVRYSSGQDVQMFDVAPGGALSNRTTGTPGLTGFNQPLDVTQHPATGFLYVTELGANRITLVRPDE
jgi:glucose/arabinose dehydrogenase